jgi:acyl-CoA dehydrogenase
MRELLAETVERILADLCTPAVVRAAEEGAWPEPLWRQIEEASLPAALVPESAGGAGLYWHDVLPVLVACGRHAVPVPLGEAIVAHGIAASVGKTLPKGIPTLALLENRVKETSVRADGLTVQARAVPYARNADHVVGTLAPAESERSSAELVVLSTRSARVTPAAHSGGEDRCDLEWNDVVPEIRAPIAGGTSALEVGAALRTAQLAGAIARVLELSVRYAGERKQFGKSIGKFQAIQQQLAVLGELATASAMAAELACNARGTSLDSMHVACAKARASEAASTAAAIAHAVHGAIGVTAEHDLQLFTRRLWMWRLDFGSESYWTSAIGRRVLDGEDRSAWMHVIEASAKVGEPSV